MRVLVGKLVRQPATDLSLEELIPLHRDLCVSGRPGYRDGREGTLLGDPALGCLVGAGSSRLQRPGKQRPVWSSGPAVIWEVGGQRDSQVVLVAARSDFAATPVAAKQHTLEWDSAMCAQHTRNRGP